MLNLYLLTQDTEVGYDTYDSMVVAANDAQEARMMVPDPYNYIHRPVWPLNPKDVQAKYIGNAGTGIKEGIILTSFNAG